MNLLLNIVIDLLAGAVNVAAIRWPEVPMSGTVPESEFERRAFRFRKITGTLFFLALVVIPLLVMGWLMS